jgi:hypothetical protein
LSIQVIGALPWYASITTMEESPDKHTDTSRPVAVGRDSEEYIVSVMEAAELFTQAGLPRTERAIQRFCKKGDLLCAFQETTYGARYLIKRSSIDRLIAQKLQTNATTLSDSHDDNVATGRDRSRHTNDTVVAPELIIQETRRETPVHGRDTEERQAATGRDEELQKLHEENLGLKIDVAGKQAFIHQLVAERQQFMSTAQELSYKLGAAETRVHQLEAPRRDTDDTSSDELSRPVVATIPEFGVTSAPVGEGSPAPSNTSRAESEELIPSVGSRRKSSVFRRLFGS